jgi:hypothetical protein
MEKLYIYNQNGQLINTLDFGNYDNELHDIDNYSRSKANGVVYNNDNGTINKTINSKTTVVFTVPEWQKDEGLYTAILIISSIAFGVFITIKVLNNTEKRDKNKISP